MDESLRARRVEAVRRFGRFYTRRIGALREGLLESPFSLTEARVIYELAHKEMATASEISEELGLDAGYLSRVLRSFGKRGLVQRKPDANDGRQYHLWLSERGQEAFARLNAASSREIDVMLRELSERDQARLVEAMSTIEKLLGSSPPRHAPYLLRPPQPGDMGWVVQRHGTLYAQEYGWDETFEALVAGIVAKFIQNFDPRRERCWIAEKDGENAGSVFVVKHTKTVAKLRLLLVEPRARGLGIGRRLVEECVRFARERGYKKMTLWTNDVLHAARHIYEAVGFELVREENHHSFGHDLVGQTWDKKL
ncbi:MAG TPA: helix-turn-helix domain-containing GNAT family N-acetyltransferase [Vicinamibacteria bacterium]|nr:helix-turn-helix domain-containing GNAT family N-acetyltransferase [Vicinamibacteria bacterium]